MDQKTRAMLNDAEQALLRETTKRRLAALDEDELIDLHTRIRRARSKYVKLHRRRGAAQVKKDRSRTRAAGTVSRTAVKAETFEDALGTVSAQLAKVAAASAESLKRERLAAARAGAGARKSTKKKAGTGKRTKTDPKRARSKAPIERKRVASARSSQRRSEARRSAKR